jgi:predicted permease
MRRLRLAWSRLTGALFGRRRDHELASEIESHIQLHTDDNIRAGMSPSEARRAALLRFGGVESAKEKLRDQRGLPGVESFFSDVRYALRQLASRPGFTITASLTLAVGIAASTAIFSVVYGVLLSPLPYADSDRLAQIVLVGTDDGAVGEYLTGMDFLDLRDNVSGFESIASFYNYRETGFNIEANGRIERARSLEISSQFFDVYGVAPIIGRAFTEPDERDGVQATVLSHRLWHRLFNEDQRVIGQVISADGVGYEVIGVMPEGFKDTHAGDVDLWIPHNTVAGGSNNRGNYYVTVVAKAAEGVSFAATQTEINAVRQRLAEENPNIARQQPQIAPLEDRMIGSSRAMLFALLAGAGLVLLIACMNLGAMLLVRGYQRQRELATRAALGSSRTRLIQQLLTESLTLAVFGGVAGMVLGVFALEGLKLVVPESLPRAENIAFDWRIFLAGCGLTGLTAMLFGWIPSWRASRINIESALREASRGGSAGVGQHRLHQGLIVAQVAMAVIVLIGAGLLTKSFQGLLRSDLGISPENVLVFEVSLPDLNYPDGDDRARFYSQLHEQLEALPGVTAAGATSWLPASGEYNSWGYRITGGDPDSGWNTNIRVVQSSYFEALGIRLIKGRSFGPHDQANSQPVVVVSESLARRHWPDGGALGEQLQVAGDTRTIVGVVADTRYDHRVSSSAKSYIAHEQFSGDRNWALMQTVKTTSAPDTLLPLIESELAGLDSSLVVHHVRQLEDVVASAISRERFAMLLMSSFGWTALLLAIVGIYGVLSYIVAQRTREIGIRTALGAGRSEILWSVATRALRVTVAGAIVGCAIAAVGMRWLDDLLYEVTSVDSVVFASVIALTTAAAILACIGPAKRAINVSPTEALRQE